VDDDPPQIMADGSVSPNLSDGVKMMLIVHDPLANVFTPF
jgi:hypothetical protein